LLYFGSVDVVSHRFWKYMDPSTYAFGSVDPAEVTAYGQAVEGAYRAVDEQIGRVVELEGDGTRLLVVSDHGFKANVDPRRMTSGWHRPQGILLAVGDGFRSHTLLGEGSVVDVAPTVLYALGLPVAEDFDGRPALDLFTEAYRSAHAVTSIASWEPEVARVREATPIASPVDGQIMERLKSLGYLQ
jgi:predicted AlkP superfamily phosphohydrolase/phosphomutase